MTSYQITTLQITNTKPMAFFDVLLLPSGELLASESSNHQIWLISCDKNSIVLFAGGGVAGYKDGLVTEALFNWPTSMDLLSDGTILIADQGNHRIRYISPDRSIVKTLAGSGMGYLDGPCETAKFNYCISLCVTMDDLIYVSDHMNHRIRLINNGIVSTIAGNGTLGYMDDDLLNSSFNSPAGIKLDIESNILVADGGNHCIRKINLNTCTVSTICGVPCISGSNDGIIYNSIDNNECAKFNKPLLATSDGEGNIYISDYNNSQIRKMDSVTGIIYTICDDRTNKLLNPYNIAFDLNGNIIVADWGNNRLKLISTECKGNTFTTNRYSKYFRNIPNTSFEVDMMNMLNNAINYHSDFTFIVDEVIIPVHKSILSARSQYFNKVLQSGMKEVTESKYIVKEASLEAFKEVLKYIYTDSLDIPSHLVGNVMLLADRFVIPRLLAFCEDHLKSNLNNSNAVEWFIWSDENNVEWFKDLAKKRIVNNFAFIREHHINTLVLLSSKRPDLLLEFFEN